ncbi:MAG: LCP family protein [Oscillospiraceae bacterium]|nr:LCP family protein [Oscillospiraceae bacterium]
MKYSNDDNFNPFSNNNINYDGDENDYVLNDSDSVNDYIMPDNGKFVKDDDDSDYDFIHDYIPVTHSETQKKVTSPTQSPYYREPYPQKRTRPSDAQLKKKRRRRSKIKRTVLSVLCVFLACLIGAGGYLSYHINHILDSINYTAYSNENKYISKSELSHSDDVLNILVIGLDDDEGTGEARSDSMMLVSLDSKHKKIKLTSFLRDMWVDIPDYKTAKLNASCSHGGAQLVIDTIETNFKVDIDNYVMVNFNIFVEIVNELGGIDVDVSKAESDAMAKFDCIVEPGENVHLDGEQTLWYARIRKCDSDFQRTSRQREVVTLLFDKLKTKNVKELYDLGLNVLQKVQTGFTKSDLKKMIVDVKNRNSIIKYLSYDIEQMSVPADGTWNDATIKGQMVLEVDIDKNSELLKDFIYGDS